jgi:NDP-sugar pyrophosphorylase family protein
MDSKLDHAVILAGGVGSRLQPYTNVLPKPLMPVGNSAILEIIIKHLKSFGIKRITLSVGYLSELIVAFFGNGEKFGVDITYIQEDEPLGTAGVLFNLKVEKNPFILMNGDILTDINYLDLFNFHNNNESLLTLAVFQRSIETEFGVLDIKDDLLLAYEEKPIISHLVSSGIYVINPSVLKFLPEHKIKYDMPHFINNLLSLKVPLNCFKFSGIWLDIGRKEDYEHANQKLIDFKNITD